MTSNHAQPSKSFQLLGIVLTATHTSELTLTSLIVCQTLARSERRKISPVCAQNVLTTLTHLRTINHASLTLALLSRSSRLMAHARTASNLIELMRLANSADQTPVVNLFRSWLRMEHAHHVRLSLILMMTKEFASLTPVPPLRYWLKMELVSNVKTSRELMKQEGSACRKPAIT